MPARPASRTARAQNGNAIEKFFIGSAVIERLLQRSMLTHHLQFSKSRPLDRPRRYRLPSGTAFKATLFFLRRLQHFLAGRRELVALLGEAGDDPSAARYHAFAVFFEVARAGIALLGSQLLREYGLRRAQQADGGEDRAYHPVFLSSYEPIVCWTIR